MVNSEFRIVNWASAGAVDGYVLAGWMVSKRYHKNVDGDFYVEDQCCIICGIPTQEAPDLFRMDENGNHCYVCRQPEDTSEIERMVQVMSLSELACIRYSGKNPGILDLMRESGMVDLCDCVPKSETVCPEAAPMPERRVEWTWLNTMIAGFKLLWRRRE